MDIVLTAQTEEDNNAQLTCIGKKNYFFYFN